MHNIPKIGPNDFGAQQRSTFVEGNTREEIKMESEIEYNQSSYTMRKSMDAKAKG